MSDPERFDADPNPDPTFHADADLDPNLFAWECKNNVFTILKKLVMGNFLSNDDQLTKKFLKNTDISKHNTGYR